MTVIVKYIVERNGEEKMTFTSKAEADAYDKMLDMADDLSDLLGKSELITESATQDALALFLAEHKDELLSVLGAKRKTAPAKVTATKSATKNAVDKTANNENNAA